MITVSASIDVEPDSGVGRSVFCGWELRTGNVLGSGTVTVAADDINAARVGSENGIRVTASSERTKLVTGLTAGNQYNVQTMHRVGAATGVLVAEVENRRLIVTPVL